MQHSLVECIPNFSEARQPEVIDKIIEAIKSVPEVYLLDRHSDLDHNRTVLTFLGKPEAVEEAAFRSISAAAQWIDLDRHSGEHPRIGATDVVPFVPIANISMAECVEIAKRLGKRVGEELKIPVYLYEKAATRPERQNLENIRHGQYETLKVKIGKDPAREPDFGPSSIGPAGATVIGARHPLIAFNAYLSTDDVRIAQKISKAIRHSSGGLRYVKAIGLLVEGRAQVSMNLTNFRQTPIGRVVEMIRLEAARHGVNIHHCELVGLIPQDALVDAAQWYLQLEDFHSEQILEKRIYEVLSAGVSVETFADAFLDRLADSAPTPAGGSASAYCGAQAAALVAMVARITLEKQQEPAVEKEMTEILHSAEDLRFELAKNVQRDAEAFNAYITALRLPKDSPQAQVARSEAVRQAAYQIALIPLEVARHSGAALGLAAKTAAAGYLNVIADAASAAALARAAIEIAGLNLRANLQNATLDAQNTEFLQELQEIEKQASAACETVQNALNRRASLKMTF